MSPIDSILDLWRKVPSSPYYKQQGWKVEGLDPKIPFLQLSAAFGLLIFLIERWLDQRQLARYRDKNAKVPDKRIPEDVFYKSLDYGKDKLSFAMFSTSVKFVLDMMLLFIGFLPYIWDMAGSSAQTLHLTGPKSSPLYRECIITSIFISILMIQSTITDLPFSLYFTFVIEAKHGFNKQTIGLFFKDMIMQLFLSLAIGSPCISVVIALARLGGQYYYVYVWAFLFLFQLVMMTVYPEYIAPLFNKFSPLDPDTHGALKTEIEALATRVSFPLTKLFVIDGSKRSSHSNAYFYGFFKNKRIVLFDTLLKQVTNAEILAILGHEIGHWALSHTMQGFIISQSYIFALFTTFSLIESNRSLFAAFGFHFDVADSLPVFIGLVLFTSTYWSPVDKVLSFFVNLNSRRNEFAADQYGKSLGYARELASGLIKLQIENMGNMVPDPLYSVYHFSHPPLVERLKPLETGDDSKKQK